MYKYFTHLKPGRSLAAAIRRTMAVLLAVLLCMPLWPNVTAFGAGGMLTLSMDINGPVEIMGEGDIQGSEIKSIKLSFSQESGITWADDAAISSAKRAMLLQSFTAGTQQAEWEEAKRWAYVSLSGDKRELTVSFDQISQYNITSDQIITFNLPLSLLSDSASVSAEQISFTIKADKTLYLNIDSITQNEIITGGKKVSLTLVNERWASDIVTKAAKRDKLFELFWDISPDIVYALKAASDPSKVVELSNDSSTVTITLQPIERLRMLRLDMPEYNRYTIGSTIDGSMLQSNTTFTIPSSPVNETPSITVLSGFTTYEVADFFNVMERDIYSGEGGYIGITLIADEWAADILSNTAKQKLLVENMKARTEEAQWKKVKSEITKGLGTTLNIIREGNTLYIRIPKVTEFDIKGSQVIDVIIPKSLLTISSTDLSGKSFIIDTPVQGNLAELLDSGMDTLISAYTPRQINITAPKRYISKIEVLHSSMSGGASGGDKIVTNVDIYTDASIQSIDAEVDGQIVSSSVYKTSKNMRIFTVGFAGLDTEGGDITVKVTGAGGESVEEKTLKFAQGKTSKSYKSKAGTFTLYELISNNSKIFNDLLGGEDGYKVEELIVTSPGI